MSTPSFSPTNINAAAVPRQANPTTAATPLNQIPVPLNASPNAHYLLPGFDIPANAHAWTSPSSSHILGGTPSFLGRATSVALSQPSAGSPAYPARFMLGGRMNPTQLNGNVSSRPSQAGGKPVLDDAERRRRLEQVVTLLGDRPGTVGREGLERLARKFGMDALWEEGRQGDGAGTLSLAGGVMVCEVELLSTTTSLSPVSRVALSFPGSSDAVGSTAFAATRLLWRNLTPPPALAAPRHAAVLGHVCDQARAVTTLSAFESNLRRLADMDKLSGPGANCFEAVLGVYTALRRLFDHEKNMIRHMNMDAADQMKASGIVNDGSPVSDEKSELEIMCVRSGRPRMHVGGTVGLSLEYWMCERLVRQRRTSGEMQSEEVEGSAMDTTGDEVDDHRRSGSDAQDNDMFRLVIETEHSVPEVYPLMRITDDWLSISPTSAVAQMDATVLPTQAENATSTTAQVTWHDPPPLLRPSTEPSTSHSARFVAILSPTLVVPEHIAAHIYASLGVSSSTYGYGAATSYTSLVLRTPVPIATPRVTRDMPMPPGPTIGSTAATATPPSPIHCTIAVHAPASGPCPSIVLSRLPFAHPRQLVALLPLLRQWAACQALLRRSFGDGADGEGGALGSTENGSIGASRHGAAGDDGDSDDDRDDDTMLDELLGPTLPLKMSPSSPTVPRRIAPPWPRTGRRDYAVDITFHPLHADAPRFTVVVSSAYSAVKRPTGNSALARAAFSVGLDGAIKLVAADGFTREAVAVEGDKRAGSGEIMGDHGVTMTTTTTTTTTAVAEIKAGQVGEALARTLAVCEDFGMWAVWVRERCRWDP